MENLRELAVVTGGSRGIGRAICIKLASLGMDIVINYAGNDKAADETKELCESLGAKVLLAKGNVSDGVFCKDFFATVMKEFGRIDVLVNNAGITRDNLIMRMKEEEFDDVIAVNLKGCFQCMKQVTRPMMKARKGRIINISSVVGIVGNMGQCNYAASKAGIIGMTKSIAKELASRGIRVNAIAPGFIETDMTKELSSDIKEACIKEVPLGAMGQPEDIAEMVAFLAGKGGNYITGQVICVDGGMVM